MAKRWHLRAANPLSGQLARACEITPDTFSLSEVFSRLFVPGKQRTTLYCPLGLISHYLFSDLFTHLLLMYTVYLNDSI